MLGSHHFLTRWNMLTASYASVFLYHINKLLFRKCIFITNKLIRQLNMHLFYKNYPVTYQSYLKPIIGCLKLNLMMLIENLKHSLIQMLIHYD